MAFDEADHRVQKTGDDTTSLKQQSWMIFEGRHHHYTHVISAYMSCKISNDRYKTVFNQYKRYFMT